MEDNYFPIEAIPCFHASPLQARLSLLFSFSAFLLPARSLLRGGAGFLSSRFAVVPDSLATGSHASNRAGLGLWRCRFLTWLSKSHTGPHRAEFVFSPQNELTPPPKGGGAGYRLSWVGRVGSVRSKLAHTPPTGRVCCFDGVVLLPSHLTGHKSPHRAEFGFCLLAGASQEDHPPFRQSRIRTQAEEKNTSALLLKIYPG